MNDFLPLADIIKVDFMGVSLDEIRKKVGKLPKKTRLLAEKIETWDEFRMAVDMGFSLFQGYFFCKPEVVKGREVPAASVTLLEIMKEVNNKNLDFDKVTSKIVKDVSISYKLLRYINSAFFQRVQPIASIKNALVYLGQDELRRFISVILMSNLASSTTPELAIASCVRARFCELVGFHVDSKEAHPDLFTLGLFSLIDAILDQPMEKIMKDLPLSDVITDALINHSGILSPYIDLAVAFGKGDWEGAERYAEMIHIDTVKLPSIYNEAVQWAEAVRTL
jgi:EAL and modified HD-GYP domain-containing signal transduction protein